MKAFTALLPKSSSTKCLLTLLAATACSLQHASAGQQIETGSSEKLVSSGEAPPKEGGFYVGIFGGVNVAQSADSKSLLVPDARPQTAGTPAQIAAYRATPGNDIPPTAVLIPNGANNPTPSFGTSVSSNTGWLGGLKFGYVIPSTHRVKLGLEFEAFYNGIDTQGHFKSDKALNGIRTTDRDGDESEEPFLNPDATVPQTKLTADTSDKVNAAVFMWNSYLRFDLGRVRPYLGGGIGLAYVTHNYSMPAPPPKTSVPAGAVAPLETKFIGNPLYDGGAVARLPLDHSTEQIENSPAAYVTFKDDSEVTFAYQALAGVDVVLTHRLSVFTEYKALFYLDGPYYHNLLNHEVTLGVRLGF